MHIQTTITITEREYNSDGFPTKETVTKTVTEEDS